MPWVAKIKKKVYVNQCSRRYLNVSILTDINIGVSQTNVLFLQKNIKLLFFAKKNIFCTTEQSYHLCCIYANSSIPQYNFYIMWLLAPNIRVINPFNTLYGRKSTRLFFLYLSPCELSQIKNRHTPVYIVGSGGVDSQGVLYRSCDSRSH